MSTAYQIGEIVTPGDGSWVPIAERLEQLSDGEGIHVALDDPSTAVKVYAAVRQRCISRGFNASFRRTHDGFNVYKRMAAPKFRADAIARDLELRWVSGETLDEIGQSLGVSRQAVEQKIKTYRNFQTLPITERSEALREFLAPFLAVLSPEALCILCRKAGNRLHGVCTDCSQTLNARSEAASRLRSYRISGKQHDLSMAMVLIRKYSFTPEDLERM